MLLINTIKEILRLKKKLYDKEGVLNDELEHYKDLLSKVLPDEISGNIDINESMKIKGSFGQGRLSEVPWVAILDETITKSTQRGYYIVLLFHPKGEGVYITLNQGWKNIKEMSKETNYSAVELAKTLSIKLASYMDDTSDNYKPGPFEYFDTDQENEEIMKSDNPKGYSLATVLYKYYKFDEQGDFTEDDIIYDIKKFILYYRQIKNQVSEGYYNLLIQNLENIHEIKVVSEIQSKNKAVIVEDLKNKNFGKKKTKTTKRRIKDEDLQNALKEKGVLGKKGEEIVKEFFKDFIHNNIEIDKQDEFMKSIVIESEKAHGAGYDIKAFDLNEKNTVIEVFYEVKATKDKEGVSPFYISLNELFAMKEKRGQYKILRIFDIAGDPKIYIIDPYKQKDEYEDIEELLSENFKFESIGYKILGLK